MFNTKYMDGAGLSHLWERIQMLVYECAGKNTVKYRLEVDGDTVSLVGSDGSTSTVTITATASCEE